MKNILLLCGGGGTEHEVSLVSSKYIEECLRKVPDFNVIWVEICKDQIWRTSDRVECELRRHAELVIFESDKEKTQQIHFAVPCIHGPPGETGDIQSVFELMGLSYLGPRSEASRNCFNKITTKLWFEALGIPNTPFIFLSSIEEIGKAKEFMEKNGQIFVKAASQGSSVGCHQVNSKDELENALKDAFNYSSYVIVEKMVKARELEISVYEYEGQIYASDPGEIICPSKFYSYSEKYSNNSHTSTEIKAKNIDQKTINLLKKYARDAFINLKITHLSRIDFFLTQEGQIYLNEINTFPGMTPISMFPKMMEGMGHSFPKFLEDIVRKSV